MPQAAPSKQKANKAEVIQVRDLMTTDVSYCDPATSAAAAAELMWRANCGALPVCETGGRVIGIVTDRDLFIGLGTRNQMPAELRVEEIMSRDLALCTEEDPVREALQTMADQQVQRLPVVDQQGTLKGILSVDDLVLRAEAEGLSSGDVLATMKAISSRQMHPKAGQLQPL